MSHGDAVDFLQDFAIFVNTLTIVMIGRRR